MTAPLEPTSLRWGFSTLGCPELSFAEVCELASQFALSYLELRALCGRVDLPALAAEKHWDPAGATSLASHHACKVVVAGSSFKLVGNDDKSRAELLEYCRWADSWNIPFVRIFGGGSWGTALTGDDLTQAVETVQWWRQEQARHRWRTEILLETHDAFSASEPCCELLERLDNPLGLIWDSHHTWRLGKESPQQSWNRLGPLVRHVHIKDSVDQPSARHPYTYVMMGDGQVPLAEIISLLEEQRFAGVVSLEWEKLWHPYLPPLRQALERLQMQPWFAGSRPGPAIPGRH